MLLAFLESHTLDRLCCTKNVGSSLTIWEPSSNLDMRNRTNSKKLKLEIFCIPTITLSKKILNILGSKMVGPPSQPAKQLHVGKEIGKSISEIAHHLFAISVAKGIYRINIYPMSLKTIYCRCKFPEGILAMAESLVNGGLERWIFFAHTMRRGSWLFSFDVSDRLVYYAARPHVFPVWIARLVVVLPMKPTFTTLRSMLVNCASIVGRKLWRIPLLKCCFNKCSEQRVSRSSCICLYLPCITCQW